MKSYGFYEDLVSEEVVSMRKGFENSQIKKRLDGCAILETIYDYVRLNADDISVLREIGDLQDELHAPS